ncbi:MAG: metallophosphoesterase family protein [Oscillospiraceae bacterium]|nr:metallophosphoesterase family protein [Oscillospiraceae bacterium]
MATFFISDTHFGDSAIIDYCNRPFATVDEMNRALIGNWNSRVSNDDDVYIIGDVFYTGRGAAGHKDAIAIVEQLKGKLHLVAGNHDFPYLKKMDYHYLFADVDQVRYLRHDGEDIFMCHYPMTEWSGFYRGSWHIYGHIHNHKNAAHMYMKNLDKALNAAVEIINYMPVTFNELKMYNEEYNLIAVSPLSDESSVLTD